MSNKYLNFKPAIRRFFSKSSLHGLKVLLLKYSPLPLAREIWMAILFIIIICAFVTVINLLIHFEQQPTDIRMSTNLLHIANSPIPALAICTANQISKIKLNTLSEQLFRVQQQFQPKFLANSVEDMSNQLLAMGGLYLLPFDDYYPEDDERLKKLHTLLMKLYNREDYPSREILRDLAPDCNETIIKGKMFGKPIKIDEYFTKRLTTTSVCCMFNYDRDSYSQEGTFFNDTQQKSIKIESSTILNNIQFLLRCDPMDVAFKELMNNAFKVHIFPREDYATVQSNVAGEVFVDYNTIVDIPIQPVFYTSSPSIKAHPPRKRNCYFPEEGQQIMNKTYYSFDECLLICRMESMVKYCGCVNPSAPAPLIGANYCDLLDLPCLTQWKSVWYRWNAFDYVYDDAQTETLHHSTFESCSHCLPTCDGTNFKIYSNSMNLRKSIGKKYTSGILNGTDNGLPLAIVKLYFQHLLVQATVKDIASDWVVLLNRFGGIMSLMYGFSIISCIEIVYFCIIKCIKTHNANTKMDHPQDIKGNGLSDSYSLYWDELKPKKIRKF